MTKKVDILYYTKREFPLATRSLSKWGGEGVRYQYILVVEGVEYSGGGYQTHHGARAAMWTHYLAIVNKGG